MKRPYYIQEPVLSNQFIDTGEMVIEVPYPYNDYVSFIAECYEAEDEFWKEIYEDLEAEYWINEYKNNYFENLKKLIFYLLNYLNNLIIIMNNKLISVNPILRFKIYKYLDSGKIIPRYTFTASDFGLNFTNLVLEKELNRANEAQKRVNLFLEADKRANKKVKAPLLPNNTAKLQDLLWRAGAFKGVKDRRGRELELTYEKAVDGIDGPLTLQAMSNYEKIKLSLPVVLNNPITKSINRPNGLISMREMTHAARTGGISLTTDSLKWNGNYKTPNILINSNAGTRLAAALGHGIFGYSPLYNEYDVPNRQIRVLDDLNLFIYDNVDLSLLANIYSILGKIKENPENKENYINEINNLLLLRKNISKSGGFNNYLKQNPGKTIRIGGNFANYKNKNYSRFGNSSIPSKYANFNEPNYGNYAIKTPLGLVENIYGETLHFYTYNPNSNKIETFVTDYYDFNPYGNAGEGSVVKQLRQAAGNNKILGRTTGSYKINLSPIVENQSKYITNPEDFAGATPIEEDSNLLKWIMNFGKEAISL